MFVGALMRELDAGVPLERAKVVALREARETRSQRGGEWSDEAVARVADQKLRKGVVREAMAGYLEARTGMSPGDMLAVRVGIARGEFEDARAASVQLRALEGLEKLTFVPATQRVEIDSRSHLSAVVMSDLGGGTPRMDARVVTPLETSMPGAERLEPVTLEHDEEEPDL